MKKQIKKLFALLLTVVMIGTSLLPEMTAEAAISHGSTVTVTQMQRLSGALGGYFTVSGATGYGYCAQNGLSFWSNNTSKTGIAYEWNDATVRKLLYYAPGGPGYSGTDMASDMDDTTFAIGYMNGMCENNTRARARIAAVANLVDPIAYGYIAYKVDITDYYQGNLCQDVAFLAVMPKGNLSLKKVSANPELTNGNSCYSLEGACFNVYSDAGCKKLVGGLRTDKQGISNTLTLDAGTYYVQETVAPKGFIKDDSVHTVKVTAGGTTTLTVKNEPFDDPIGVLLQKVDAETGKPSALAGASLKGAEYTVKYYDAYYNTEEELADKEAKLTWVFATDETGYIYLSDTYKVSGPELYYDSYGEATMPLGTITIQETSEPQGYKINEELFIRHIKRNENMDDVITYNVPTAKEEVFRGDLEFTKIDSESKKTMANIQFKLTQVETGESHILITDEKGYVNTSSSRSLHSNHTNRGQHSSDGVWFGMDSEGNVAEVDDTLGALPYGTYKLEELRCEANKGYDLFEAVTFTINSNKQVINLGNVVNHYVDLSTTALDKETKTHVSYADNEVTIIDTVSYKGLTPGKTYKLSGAAYDKETKVALTINGKNITVETEFVPTQSNGTTDVTFTFNGTSLLGKSIVFTETLYRDGIFIQEHHDLEDEEQSIYFPEIKTNATDKETGKQLIKADETVTISDKVTYKKLSQGEYKISGILMDTETGESLKVNGKEITQEVTFVTDGKDGSQIVDFVLDASDLEGRTITVFEKLYDSNGNVVAIHEDINDESQTVRFPKVGTKATDKETGTNIVVAKENNIITDTVSFENLVVGNTYKVTGTLMNKDTKEPLLQNGKTITATKTFTAETKDGSVEIEFAINGNDIAGKTTVVFEELYFESALIGEHKDINDEEQTVYIPKLATTAYEKESGTNNPIVKETNVIVDETKYSSVPEGLEYTIKGYLMDKETNDYLLVDGQRVEAQKTFVADETNGSVTLEFEISEAAAGGKEIVVFEELYLGDRLIASHTDINAAEQTVDFDYKEDIPTGDTADIIMWVFLASGAAFLIYMYFRKKKNKDKTED